MCVCCREVVLADLSKDIKWVETSVSQNNLNVFAMLLQEGFSIGSLLLLVFLYTAPRLDMNKSLEEQYNFNIKPYLLHLR